MEHTTIVGSTSRKKRNFRQGSPNPSTNALRPSKRTRSQRGSLENLMNIPMELICEIFGLLDPLDLLHLARTNKTLRNMLMHRSSRAVWKAARTNIPGLPDCPDDLNEPRYAELVFVARCSVSM
ncbi:hypothetical protein BDN70DRAFT_815322 [Pholiota conissans]|uniref:F-box domain-containing protein n=1 Tax=Pholiota conissans TaxID=109636 RepID=A0A9P5YSJ6_9AGAR|nr:hypothetical protein BDN70DRAFT_815322 [Pholiota conissans]